MTVQELIKELQQAPPEAPVTYHGPSGRQTDVAFVHTRIDSDSHEPSIFLE